MFVLKNRHAPELSGANCRGKLSHSKQLLKKYSFRDIRKILSTDEKYIYSAHTENPKESPTVCDCSNQEDVATISRRVTIGRENTSLILVDDGVKVIEGCYRNVLLL